MEHLHVSTWQGADSFASFAPPDPAAPKCHKGTWFDWAVDFRSPEGEALTKAALVLIAAVEKRNRRRRPVDEVHHAAVVRSVLANGFRCHYFRRPSLVAYHRRADSYGDGPAWLSGKAMSRTVDLLTRAGLLDAFLGRWGVVSSTYRITEALCGVAQACGITDHSLTLRVPLRRLVRLREGGSGTPQRAFTSTGETLSWTGRLRAYNAFVAHQDIGLELTAEDEAEWVRHWNKKRKRKWGEDDLEGCHLYRPERIQTDLYRQFNHASFEQGGRLYGGWWINMPKALRRKITINGQPTVELDFSGCFIRMLYHQRGLDYQGDPYRLDAIGAYEAKRGLPPDHFRQGVKEITQALINDRNGKKPERIALTDGLSFRPSFKRFEVRRMIEGKHAPIADAFGTGAGLHLQRFESDLALRIISELSRRDVLALPIHDSFLVCKSRGFEIGVLMNRLYRESFGFDPAIKRTE